MAKVLFLNPSKWGRGITPIWVASHTSILRNSGHTVSLFDCSFYKSWTQDETSFNTANKQYLPSDISSYITWNESDLLTSLNSHIESFKPDIIFWSAISSHIHGEGEYINFQYGYDLISSLNLDGIVTCAGGLIPTADPQAVSVKFPLINHLILGESECSLLSLADSLDNGCCSSLPRIINNSIPTDLSSLPPYDYSLFDTQSFYRPYRGKVLKAVDIELSRGCPFTCDYCVETVIQKHYGFTESNDLGVLKESPKYLRSKNFENLISELSTLYHEYGIRYFRFQDTNFLTANRTLLAKLAASSLFTEFDDFFLYIETRPETINPATVQLLKSLHVDGVGMGVELSSDDFRMDNLNRSCNTSHIINAFSLLKDASINRTSYNVIGFPHQTEAEILSTIELNRLLSPDNITVAYYSPYIGTNSGKTSFELSTFSYLEGAVDGQLRTVSQVKNLADLTPEKLDHYKSNFVNLCRS